MITCFTFNIFVLILWRNLPVMNFFLLKLYSNKYIFTSHTVIITIYLILLIKIQNKTYRFYGFYAIESTFPTQQFRGRHPGYCQITSGVTRLEIWPLCTHLGLYILSKLSMFKVKCVTTTAQGSTKRTKLYKHPKHHILKLNDYRGEILQIYANRFYYQCDNIPQHLLR